MIVFGKDVEIQELAGIVCLEACVLLDIFTPKGRVPSNNFDKLPSKFQKSFGGFSIF